VNLRVTRSARKHHIGSARIIAAMANAGRPTEDGDRLIYVGEDDRGVELLIIAVPDDRNPGGLAVIHASPTAWRNRRKP
jgi:hypothetical protein